MVLQAVLLRRLSWRGIALAVAVGALHAGIVVLLMSLTNADKPHVREPKPIQVLILPLQTPKPPEPLRAHRERTRGDRRERNNAITYPPVPESGFTGSAIPRGPGIYRDCALENLASLSPEERERCARIVARLPDTNGETDPTLDPQLRAQWSAEVIAKGRIPEGPFHKCIGTRRSLLGLNCWGGFDN